METFSPVFHQFPEEVRRNSVLVVKNCLSQLSEVIDRLLAEMSTDDIPRVFERIQLRYCYHSGTMWTSIIILEQ